MKKAGCPCVFTDTIRGARPTRPDLDDALSQVRKSDTLTVWKLDRLGRRVKGFVELAFKGSMVLFATDMHYRSR